MKRTKLGQVGVETMVNTGSVDELPLSYRQALVRPLMQWLNAGDSCSIVGASGTAKSNLFRHLCKLETRRHYLPEKSSYFLFLGLDSHALSDLNEAAVYDSLFELLLQETDALKFPAEAAARLGPLAADLGGESDASIRLKAFKRAVSILMAVPGWQLALVFDQFDELYAAISPRFLVHLRSIRDQFKQRISYVTLTRQELPDIRRTPEGEEFYELLQPHVVGLGPYDEKDAWHELERVGKRYGVTPEGEQGNRLIRLTGGHPGLLKAAFMSTFSSASPLPTAEDTTIEVLLENRDVEIECSKLWRSLGKEEHDALHLLERGIPLAEDSEGMRRLKLKGLVTRAGKIFSALFAQYITEVDTRSVSKTNVQAGPIRIDTAGEVWVSGRKIEPPLPPAELDLLYHLCRKPGELCTKDELIGILHPDKTAQGETASDAALAAVVERLRKQIEPDPHHPQFVITRRGKGYLLKV